MGQELIAWGADLAALGIGGKGTWRQVERTVKHGIVRIKHGGLGCASFMCSFWANLPGANLDSTSIALC
jgi:hypothetical protein